MPLVGRLCCPCRFGRRAARRRLSASSRRFSLYASRCDLRHGVEKPGGPVRLSRQVGAYVDLHGSTALHFAVAPRMTLARRHSIIVLIMSAFASPSNVVRWSLPIHLDTLVKVVSLSHRYSKSVPFLAYVLSSHQDLLEVFVRLNHSVTASIGGCAQSLCLMKHFALFHSSFVASNPASLIWPNDGWLLEFLGNTIPPHLSALCGTPFARNS